jgi:hypothetical protein
MDLLGCPEAPGDGKNRVLDVLFAGLGLTKDDGTVKNPVLT